MDKLKSTLPNMVIVLGLISAILGIVLGYVYTITKEPIAKVQIETLNKGIKAVVSGFDSLSNNYKVVANDATDSLIFYDCYKEGEWIGTAVKTFDNNGFGGTISVMVGFNPNGSIIKTTILSHLETPGLGDKIDAKKSNFPTQFDGKDAANFKLSVKKDGGDVDAITAATISSRAYCRSIDRAYQAFMTVKGGKQ